MGKNDTLLIVGVLGIAGAVFLFKDKIFGGGEGEEFVGGGTVEDDGTLANKCWVVSPKTKQLACSCAGQQWFSLGKGENCSDCEAHCRGQIKTKIGPFDDCSKRQNCNCAACCVKNNCLETKKSRRCPCAAVLAGIRQRQTAALEAEEDIYSYYGSIDKIGITIA